MVVVHAVLLDGALQGLWFWDPHFVALRTHEEGRGAHEICIKRPHDQLFFWVFQGFDFRSAPMTMGVLSAALSSFGRGDEGNFHGWMDACVFLTLPVLASMAA